MLYRFVKKKLIIIIMYARLPNCETNQQSNGIPERLL